MEGKEEDANKRGGGGSVDASREGCCSVESDGDCQKLQRHVLQDPDVVTSYNIHPIPSSSCLLYITVDMYDIELKELQHSSITLVFLPSSTVPLGFVFQAKYRKSLLGAALSKETYLFSLPCPSPL